MFLQIFKLEKCWSDTKNRPLWSFRGRKPIISGFDWKCVGGAKSHGHFRNQWARLGWSDTKNRPLWSFRGQKPIISSFDRKCVGGAKI